MTVMKTKTSSVFADTATIVSSMRLNGRTAKSKTRYIKHVMSATVTRSIPCFDGTPSINAEMIKRRVSSNTSQ